MSQEKIEKSFAVAAPARLNLRNIRGSVDIRPGETGALSVTAIKQTDSGDAKGTEIELSQASDGTVTAATHFPEGWWVWMTGSKPCKVDYIVKVPRGCSLKVRGVSNSVVVQGLTGDFDFNTVSGDLTLRDLTGPLRINSVSGDVSGAGVSGALRVDTVSGNVKLDSSNLTSVSAKTVSGNLSLQTTLADGSYKFNSVSGDVRVSLPADARCSAELHTISGNLSSAFPVSSTSRGPASQTLTVQGGGVKVSLDSVSGDLRLDSVGTVQPVAPDGNRRQLLEQIARGEMTAEDALAQMKR